jgi:AraC family transcriptional regulator of adaptative response / DNA-3-methyladenine glycosylase II
VKESELDWRICSRARLSRDPRFDGKFFIGVRGSGVYCRSICPAPTAKEKNCFYFATAAAAEDAGYRPCLRCRPESSPGTPAWQGTSATVSRALRLIEASGPDGGIESLAERLGVGARHLRRLFVKHLGASPNMVVQTRRVHFAKKLIDETSLPMTQLAIAAGYGSVRRFNAAVAKTFRRTPTQIRATARGAKPMADDEYVFRLRYRPPLHWQAMLACLNAHTTPGVELIDGGVYRRTISLGGVHGCIGVSNDEDRFALVARIRFADPRALFVIVERIRALFDLNADWSDIVEGLGGDPLLRARLANMPGLRVPGCFEPFELAVRAILDRTTDGDRARDAARSLVLGFGRRIQVAESPTHVFPEPHTLAVADLCGAGIPEPSARIVRALARALAGRRIAFEGVVETDAFLSRMRELTGMDEWTAQTIAMRALREPDAFPTDGLRLNGLSGAALEARAKSWRPWRAYAAMYLGNAFAERHRDERLVSRLPGTDSFAAM